MKILFLGQNPSTKSPDTAFLYTRSGDLLLRLISTTNISLEDVKFSNVIDYPTKKNKAPAQSEFVRRGQNPSFKILILSYDIVYVCGKMAKLAVEQIRNLWNTKVVYLPHPSPKNRQWNDPETFTRIAKLIGETYESKVAENRKRAEEERSSSYDRFQRDSLSRETQSICPVVKDFERRKKKDDNRSSSRVGGASLRPGGIKCHN